MLRFLIAIVASVVFLTSNVGYSQAPKKASQFPPVVAADVLAGSNVPFLQTSGASFTDARATAVDLFDAAWRLKTSGTSLLGTAGEVTFSRIGVGAAPSLTHLAVFTQPVATSGSPSVFVWTGAVHTTLDASVELSDGQFNFNRAIQLATGNYTTQRTIVMRPPTISFVASSTVTAVSNLYVSGATPAGTNALFTRSSTLELGAAAVGSGVTTSYGLYVSPNTGATNNYAGYFNGAVGIGQAAPSYRLDVAGGALGLRVVPAAGSSSGTLALLTGAAHTNLTASTESIQFRVNGSATMTFATGALTTERYAVIDAPTIAFAGASTLTNAATLAITGAPTAGTNATITNPYAFWVQAGTSKFAGLIEINTQAAPTTSLIGTFTNRYGGATNALGDPAIWFTIRAANGTTYLVPGYSQ